MLCGDYRVELIWSLITCSFLFFFFRTCCLHCCFSLFNFLFIQRFFVLLLYSSLHFHIVTYIVILSVFSMITNSFPFSFISISLYHLTPLFPITLCCITSITPTYSYVLLPSGLHASLLIYSSLHSTTWVTCSPVHLFTCSPLPRGHLAWPS